MHLGQRQRFPQPVDGRGWVATEPGRVGEIVQRHRHRFRLADLTRQRQTGLETGDRQVVIAELGRQRPQIAQ